MLEALLVVIGVVIGAGVVLVLAMFHRRQAADLARELLASTQKDRLDDLDRVVARVKEAFAALSREALSLNSEEFLKLAGTRLDKETAQGEQSLENKKKLIDQTLETLRVKMADIHATLQTVDKDRRESHGGLMKQLQTAVDATASLQQTTAQLREALASPQARGQWGERMAEDVLRLAGMIEGVNYTKQTQTPEGTQPDFTFLLPRGLRVNMDVKFPLANYVRFLEAADDGTRETGRKSFLADVRSRVKEVVKRGYIDAADGTVDYLLLFIPNEQLYGFIHQNDPSLLDDALRMKVILCSPMTLYAILAVIHQSVDVFRLQRASTEILELLGEFEKQWTKYLETTEKLGNRLDDAVKAFEEMTTTRTRQLERQLQKIAALRDHPQLTAE